MFAIAIKLAVSLTRSKPLASDRSKTLFDRGYRCLHLCSLSGEHNIRSDVLLDLVAVTTDLTLRDSQASGTSTC